METYIREVKQKPVLPPRRLTCLVKVLECDLVDGKEADGGVVLWAHVGDGGSVRN